MELVCGQPYSMFDSSGRLWLVGQSGAYVSIELYSLLDEGGVSGGRKTKMPTFDKNGRIVLDLSTPRILRITNVHYLPIGVYLIIGNASYSTLVQGSTSVGVKLDACHSPNQFSIVCRTLQSVSEQLSWRFVDWMPKLVQTSVRSTCEIVFADNGYLVEFTTQFAHRDHASRASFPEFKTNLKNADWIYENKRVVDVMKHFHSMTAKAGVTEGKTELKSSGTGSASSAGAAGAGAGAGAGSGAGSASSDAQALFALAGVASLSKSAKP